MLGAGPLAAYICLGIQRKDFRVAFWMVVLATAELYGGMFDYLLERNSDRTDFVCVGFMTFCPEWLTGNQNLDASNFMYLWVYLVFFNMLWVVLPIYALLVSYQDICNAFLVRTGVAKARLEIQKRESEKAK